MNTSSMTIDAAEAYRRGLAEGRSVGWAVGNAAGIRTGFEMARERAVGICEAHAKEPWGSAAEESAAEFLAYNIRAMEPPA